MSDLNSAAPTDAQLNTLADSVVALTSALAAQTQRLNDAVNPPAPQPPAQAPAPAATS